LDPRMRESGNKDSEFLSNAYMADSTAKIASTVVVLALWSCKSVAPTGNLTVSNTNQDQASSNAEEKYGLSEAKRKQISAEIHSLWIQAGKLSEKRYPTVVRGEPPSIFIEKMRQRAKNRSELKQSLMEECLKELAKKYGLSQDQLSEIVNEGMDKEWTKYPKLPPEFR